MQIEEFFPEEKKKLVPNLGMGAMIFCYFA